jgi:hypothetical protein
MTIETTQSIYLFTAADARRIYLENKERKEFEREQEVLNEASRVLTLIKEACSTKRKLLVTLDKNLAVEVKNYLYDNGFDYSDKNLLGNEVEFNW